MTDLNEIKSDLEKLLYKVGRIVEEAGGRVTDWNGQSFDISKDDIIVSNGVIHDKLLDIIK